VQAGSTTTQANEYIKNCDLIAAVQLAQLLLKISPALCLRDDWYRVCSNDTSNSPPARAPPQEIYMSNVALFTLLARTDSRRLQRPACLFSDPLSPQPDEEAEPGQEPRENVAHGGGRSRGRPRGLAAARWISPASVSQADAERPSQRYVMTRKLLNRNGNVMLCHLASLPSSGRTQ